MLPYSVPTFRPTFRIRLGQEPPAQPPAQVNVTAFTGDAGIIKTLMVLAVTGAAAWTGVRAGMKEKGLLKYAGWVGGAGSALIGLLYLAGEAGGQFPHVQVVSPLRRT